MPDCCMCERVATACTAVVDGESFAVCPAHLRIWQTTPEDISLHDWCRRVTRFDRREIGRTWFCDFIDATAVCA